MKDRNGAKKVIKFIVLITIFVILVMGYGYIYIKYNIGLPCAVNKLFGIYCPGCGLTRAGIAMLQLDFYQAFRYNALSLILIPLLCVILITFIWEIIFNKESFLSRIPIAFWIILFIVIFIYGIIRNFIPDLQPSQL